MSDPTRRSLLTGGAAALAGLGVYEWIRTRPADQGLAWPLRKSLEFNEQLSRGTFRRAALAPEFARPGEAPRVNGTVGIDDDDFDAAGWRLELDGRTLTLADIRALPRTGFVTELKCVEGWSRRVEWAGARFADFARRYHSGREAYVGFATPDGEYYVGLDMASALHPQTLLCYEMNGRPLEEGHGAPLRLVVPIKYGIKNLKRIGKISFTNTRPPDYWAERGYDYYAGF